MYNNLLSFHIEVPIGTLAQLKAHRFAIKGMRSGGGGENYRKNNGPFLSTPNKQNCSSLLDCHANNDDRSAIFRFLLFCCAWVILLYTFTFPIHLLRFSQSVSSSLWLNFKTFSKTDFLKRNSMRGFVFSKSSVIAGHRLNCSEKTTI